MSIISKAWVITSITLDNELKSRLTTSKVTADRIFDEAARKTIDDNYKQLIKDGDISYDRSEWQEFVGDGEYAVSMNLVTFE